MLGLGLAVGCGGDDDTSPGNAEATAGTTMATPTDGGPPGTTADNGSTDATTMSVSGDTTDDGPTSGVDSTTSAGSSDTGTPVDAEFEEIDGVVSVEAEHYFEETNNETILTYWYTFEAGRPEPVVECVTNTPCGGGNAPMCNQYPDCDGDAIDPAEAIGSAYVEALPDRRRDDSEPGTGNLGVVNNQENAPTLHYRVLFTQTGRYYVWGHARGQGPAANGIHLGIDGTWPDNDLIDPSSMRMQFPNGWVWTQNRRGGSQHTGVSGTDEVSQRDANIWLDIESPGVHDIMWGMREDGLEWDKFVMVLDPEFEPEGDGPPETTLRQ